MTVPSPDQDGLAIARKVLQTEAAAILALVDRLDERFDRAIRLLLACRGRVIVTGMGKSGIICRKIAATLSSTGTPAHFLHPAEAIHGDLGVIQAEDVVIALSNSGETEELVRLLETIKRTRRQAHYDQRQRCLHTRSGVGRGTGLPCCRGSVPNEPGANSQHDGGTGAR